MDVRCSVYQKKRNKFVPFLKAKVGGVNTVVKNAHYFRWRCAVVSSVYLSGSRTKPEFYKPVLRYFCRTLTEPEPYFLKSGTELNDLSTCEP